MTGFEFTSGPVDPADEPPDGCEIPWQPNAFAPVFFGYRDYLVHLPEGVHPGYEGYPCRIFYPSVAADPPEEALILRGCGRFPLIVFGHGQCDVDQQHEYLKWYEQPARLARCGYVVLVPQLQGVVGFDPDDFGDQEFILRLVDWMRTGWQYAETLLPAPLTGIVGHSDGSGVAVQLAAALPSAFAAVATLSAQQDRVVLLNDSPLPKLHMWGGQADAFQPLLPEQWEALARPKHMALFDGAHHYDYQDPDRSACGVGAKRGECPLVPGLSSELLMMFIGRYLQPEGAPYLRPLIDSRLVPPTLANLQADLSEEQQFYTNPDFGSFLGAFEQLDSTPNCGVTFSVDVGAISVPDVLQLGAAQAAAKIAQVGLVPHLVGPAASDAADTSVGSQSPTAGRIVEAGTTVTLHMRTSPLHRE